MFNYLNALIGTKVKNERGQAMVEYGLIIALIAVAVVVTLGLVGDELVTMFEGIIDNLGGGAS